MPIGDEMSPPPRTSRLTYALLALALLTVVLAPTLSAARVRPPVLLTPPAISGTTQEGQDLTSSAGTWRSTAPLTVTFQWRRCDASGTGCADVANAKGTVYRLTTADVGRTLRARVTASNSGGSRSALSAATAPVAGPAPAPPPATGIWRPTPGTSWQWQLTGALDLSVDAAVYDLDLFDTGAASVSQLHALGRKAICYLSAGSWESWRPDAARFPAAVLGSGNGWPGEKWLDIRRLDVLGPIMEARLDLCKAKGFDAVEPDNIDGYTNVSGFPLTGSDQLRYNRFLADGAHARGLSIGLKNDLEQVGALLPSFDWALNESCFQWSECSLLTPFVTAGKAVFHVEYGTATAHCPRALALGFSSLQKRQSLDAWRAVC